MLGLIVSVPDHCLSFYFTTEAVSAETVDEFKFKI